MDDPQAHQKMISKQCKIDARKNEAQMIQQILKRMQHLSNNGINIHLKSIQKSMSEIRRFQNTIKIDPWRSTGRFKAQGWISTGVYGRGPGPREGGKGKGQRD